MNDRVNPIERFDPANIDRERYSVWTWKKIYMLHWMINPGLVINELILGQRIPKVMLVEKKSSKALAEKTWIPCPHCNTLHSGLKWTPQNKTAFGNWFGYYCDHCGNIIPCIWNFTSLLVLGITSPLWYGFRNSLKAKWLEGQRAKFSGPIKLSSPDYNWWYQGYIWAVQMYLVMEVLWPLALREPLNRSKLLIGIPLWMIAGAIFGVAMKAIAGKKKQKVEAA